MIPISDDNRARLAPLVTWAVIVACIVAFIWELSLGSEMDTALLVYGFKPASFFASYTPQGVGSVPAWITIFTGMFLHGGFLHIAGNMLYLWIFGNNVEDAMGHVRFLAFYLVCGVAAALALGLVNPQSQVPMIGASGAISGVLAAYVLLFPRARVLVIVPLGIILYPLRITAIWVVGFWFILQLLNAGATQADQPGVAWWAHVGGFITGLMLTPIFKSSNFPLFGSVRKSGPWG
ncbi:MAG TPA: rhomboid family intramembrane serine protease [Rhizomicrobium sp.]|nr:rhomboid family intramembrane serine protease [Rhizomicrobium sp.]